MKKHPKEAVFDTALPENKEERKSRAGFVRLFEKYDLKNEEQFLRFGKWLVFIVTVLVELLIVGQALGEFLTQGSWGILIATIAMGSILIINQVLKLFIPKEGKIRSVFYLVDILSVAGHSFVTDGALALIIYLLILTELYIGTEKTFPAFILFVFGVLLYVTGFWLKTLLLTQGEFSFVTAFTRSLGTVFALGIHFIAVAIALAFYRQFLRLDKALTELNASKRELEKAYAVVAEVTALEERQRIAKDIHDTAGHSLTTVIMQTEAAKRIIEENPKEAKSKIVAANLQAKHALEELRDSVHLLSGRHAGPTLKDVLLDIIHESTDGTGITVRSEIEEIFVSQAKQRFLCNTLKEGISNGLRHGGATAFWFELKEENGRISFVLIDNGKGLDTADLEKGFGLTTMEERATALGGEMEIYSELNEGFEIRLYMPTNP